MKTFIWVANPITILAQVIIQNIPMITTGVAMAGFLKPVIKRPLNVVANV